MKNTLLRLLGLVVPFKGWIALAILLGVATVGSGVGLLTTSAYLISAAALHPSVAVLSVAIVGVRFFGITRGIFRYLERYVSHMVTFKLLARLRVWFYQAVEPLAPARLLEKNYHSGNLLGRVVSDIETLQEFYVRVLAPPLVAVVVGVVLWFWFGAYEATLALTFLTFFILAGVGVPVLAYILSRKLGQDIISQRSELAVEIVDGIQGMADLLAFGQEHQQAARIEKLNRQLLKLQRRQAWVKGLQESLGNILMNLAAWSMFIIASGLVRDNKLEPIYLAPILLATLASFEAVLPLPLAMQNLSSCLEAARRLFELVDAKPAVVSPANPLPLPNNYSLSVKNLSFAYQSDQPLVLNNLSFELSQGHTLAIVGTSGVGKSTIVNLLLRFWDYNQGQILLGGQELRDYSPDDLHKIISVISQTTHLFNTSIRENILLARPAATQDEIESAARQAQIHNFIQSLPQGYDTRIGEQGLRLSGGERQRLAIARAILKDAPILILDEATSNLDALTEHEVLLALEKFQQGRTTLIITHRPVELEKVDEILVLKGVAQC